MYKHLKAVMLERGIDRQAICKVTGMTNGTLSRKFRGLSPFKLDECITIKNLLEVNESVDDLFKKF